jgi:hypothetical protein
MCLTLCLSVVRDYPAALARSFSCKGCCCRLVCCHPCACLREKGSRTCRKDVLLLHIEGGG